MKRVKELKRRIKKDWKRKENKIKKSKRDGKRRENGKREELVEWVWTGIPTGIVGWILIPGIRMIYAIEEISGQNKSVAVKVIGNQWYWMYEKNIGSNLFKIEAHMKQEIELKKGEQRLLEVDTDLRLPVKTNVRVLVTSNDVIHSWAVPRLGLKIDACPGRLNIANIYLETPGQYRGQCSELCGVNHAYMPISLQGYKKC